MAKVLSTTQIAPAACAISATAAMSTTPSSGLVGVSTQTILVRSRSACFTASRLVMSTAVKSSPHCANTLATTR